MHSSFFIICWIFQTFFQPHYINIATILALINHVAMNGMFLLVRLDNPFAHDGPIIFQFIKLFIHFSAYHFAKDLRKIFSIQA